eukprot:8691938-Pyramimonas_sp.AAC.1
MRESRSQRTNKLPSRLPRGAVWRPSWAVLGASWAVFGPSWTGPLSAVAEAVLGGYGRFHGPCRTLRNRKRPICYK